MACVGARIVKVPILVHLHVLVAGDQVVAGRNLEDPIKQRSHLMTAEFDRVIDGLGVPTSRHSGGKQRLHLRCEIECFFVQGVEQGLDAEAITRGKDGAVPFIPEHKGELAAQSVQALRAEIFVEMQGDLAVRARAQAMTGLLEFALDRFVAIEFAIDDDAGLSVLAGDRLISGREIDDAEPRVAKSDAAGPTISNGAVRQGRGDAGYGWPVAAPRLRSDRVARKRRQFRTFRDPSRPRPVGLPLTMVH